MDGIQAIKTNSDLFELDELNLKYEIATHEDCGMRIARIALEKFFTDCDKDGLLRKCPNCLQLEVSMEDFIVEEELLEALENIPHQILLGTHTPPARPNTPDTTLKHIDLTPELYGNMARRFVQEKDPLLYKMYLEKQVKDVIVDSTKRFVMIQTSEKWSVYCIGLGDAPAKKEHAIKEISFQNVPT